MRKINSNIIVGFDVTWMNIKNSSGGIYHYALRLISALVEFTDIRVVAMIGPNGVGIFDHLKSLNNFREVLLDTPHSFNDAIRSEQISVVHTPMQWHFNFSLSVPMVNTLHDLQPFHYPEFFTEDEIRFRNTYYKKSAEFSERVIVSYDHVKNDIVEFYDIPAQKVDVCPLGMPTAKELDQNKFPVVKEKYRLNEKYLFYSSNTWRHKNHAGLIKALKRLQDDYGIKIQLVCTGYKYDDYFPEIQSLISNLKLEDSVVFTGYIPEEDMFLILKNAELVVIPTLYEAGSFPLMEAMVYEVPVICSNVTSLPETIGDTRFTFDPKDMKDIADRIFIMLSNDQLKKENLINSQKMVQKSGWHKSVKHFVKVYAKTIEQFNQKRKLQFFNNWLLNYEFFVNDKIKSLSLHLSSAEADRAARLQVIKKQQKDFEICETDRAARLEVIQKQAKDMEACEADRAARLEVINALNKKLEFLSNMEENFKHACQELYKAGGDLSQFAEIFQTQKIVFGTDEASLFLRSGWSHNETLPDEGYMVNWAIGEFASLFLSLPKDKSVQVTANLKSLTFTEPQTITFKVDGKEIGKWQLSNIWQWEQHSITVEPDEHRPAVSIIEFAFSQKMKPEHDDRHLAVLFESLTLDTNGLKITANNFSEFTYSKQRHFACFGDNDVELYGEKKDPGLCDLKVYQDLLVYTFLKEHIPKGSRILDIGGGDSRIIKTMKNDYECWNIDKLEGVGNGPTSINVAGFRLIRDYIGNFNKELPDNYFDFVFSISALEHTPGDNKTNSDIIKDINRVMKADTFSLHCFDIVIRNEGVWTNKLLPFIFQQVKTINTFVPFSIMEKDPSIYVMSEESYNQYWKNTTQKSYKEFGKPLSYNILWKKPGA